MHGCPAPRRLLPKLVSRTPPPNHLYRASQALAAAGGKADGECAALKASDSETGLAGSLGKGNSLSSLKSCGSAGGGGSVELAQLPGSGGADAGGVGQGLREDPLRLAYRL